MNLRRGFHRLHTLLAGLWLVIAFSVEGHGEQAGLATGVPWGSRHRLAQQLARDADGFCSPAFWLTFFNDLKMVAYVVGPILAVYALGWTLITPTAWVVRGFAPAANSGDGV